MLPSNNTVCMLSENDISVMDMSAAADELGENNHPYQSKSGIQVEQCSL